MIKIYNYIMHILLKIVQITITAVTMILVAALLAGIIAVSPSSGQSVVFMQYRICEETSNCSSDADNPFSCQCDDKTAVVTPLMIQMVGEYRCETVS